MTAPSVGSPQTIAVAGRNFHPCLDTTFEQDMLIMKTLRDAGLVKLAETFDPLTENLGEAAQDLIVRAFGSGQLFRLLAATLEEDGTEWSLTACEANAVFFSKLRKKDDKDALHGSIVGVLTGFFVSGVLSSMTSRKSSPASAPDIPPVDDAPSPPSVASPDTTSENGTSSSASSPITDPVIF
jgi:hypothetical protein